MRVWRIENKNQQGPYLIATRTWKVKSHNDSNHPDIFEDGIELTVKNRFLLRCGFKSKKHLHKWFSRQEMVNLYCIGFKVSLYNCPKEHVHDTISGKQIMFDIKVANKIK